MVSEYYSHYTCASSENSFSCAGNQFNSFIYKLPFLGYINFISQILIILISIFGKIQEDYKWFALNQTILNVLIGAKLQICTYILINDQCETFYYDDGKNFTAWRFIKNTLIYAFQNIDMGLYLNLFLFTATRFIATRFPLFYKFHIKGKNFILYDFHL